MNILIKNMLDAFIGGVSYWAVGYALAYGETGDPDFPNRFCGQTYFFRLVDVSFDFRNWKAALEEVL